MSKYYSLILPKEGRPIDPDEQSLRAAFPQEYTAFQRIVKLCRRKESDISMEWADFKSFLRDVGTTPSQFHVLTLMDKGLKRYEKGNVEWSTRWRGSRPVLKSQPVSTMQIDTIYTQATDLVPPGGYVKTTLPVLDWRYPGPRPEAAFLLKFNRWKIKLGPDHQHLRFPDVYYVFSTIKALNVLASALLLMKNHTDVTNNAKTVGMQRRYNVLYRNINSAVGSIEARDKDLADRLKIGPNPRCVAPVLKYIESIS